MLRTSDPREIEQRFRERPTYPVPLNEYLVADLPDPASFRACLIAVSDETGGYTVAVSDGSDWLRLTDLAVVS